MTNSSDSEQRHPLESMASKLAASIRDGKSASIDPIMAADPQLGSELRDLLPVIRRLEKARQTQAQRPG
ncbi:MAG: hypothetical protein MI861_19420, partial [Pirellulales bacterium]|nr:hypothetical protein [Pirellulales bacterium]